METTSTHSETVRQAKGNGSAASAPVAANVMADDGPETPASGVSDAAGDRELVQDAPRGGMAPGTAEATASAVSKAPNAATAVNVLAGAIGLMMASKRHKHLFLADLEWSLLPPLALKQFRLFTKDNKPVAFATWAFVSEEVEARLKAGQMKLKPADWRSGERCWIVDVVSPNAPVSSIVDSLKRNVLGEHEVSVAGLGAGFGRDVKGSSGDEKPL